MVGAGSRMLVGSTPSLSPTPFLLKMSLIPKLRSCVFMMTEMKGEQLLFLLWIIQGCTFLPVFHAVSSWGQGLLLALVVRDEQIINFRNK